MDNPKNEEFILNEDINFKETDTLKQDDVTKKKENKNVCGFIKKITVEPVGALFILSCILTMLTTQNLNLDKACRVNLNFTTEICNKLRLQDTEGLNDTYEVAAQRLTASAMAWRSVITATIPSILALFVGSWSDLTGHRKIFIMIPMMGQILICISNMINVFFFYQLPLEVLVFSEAILESLSGAWCIAFLAIFSLISSITTKEERTFRIGIVSFSITVGFPIGMGLSGILLKKTGYYGCYGLSATLHVINLLYTALVLKDPPRTASQKEVIFIKIKS